MEEAEQGAQGRHGQLGRAAWLARAAGDHVRRDVGDRQPFEGESIRRDPAREKRPDRGDVSVSRGRGQAPLDDEVPAVPGEEPIDRCVGLDIGRLGNHAQAAQVLEQRPNRLGRRVPRVSGRATGGEEPADLGRCEGSWFDPFALEPGVQVGHQPDLKGRPRGRVPDAREVGSVPGGVRSKRAADVNPKWIVHEALLRRCGRRASLSAPGSCRPHGARPLTRRPVRHPTSA